MKRIITIVFTIWSSIAFGQADSQNNADSLKQKDGSPIHQLRIYEIPKQNRQVFHDRFKDHAHRIMKKYGFTIVAMWESAFNDKVEFIYLLEWKDESSMKTAWNNFMADQEWKDIKARTGKMHGTFVDKIEDRKLILTNYSPQKGLLK